MGNSDQPVTLDQAIKTALGHHEAGRLDQAEIICREIIRVAPDHFGALHLLGINAHQTGRHEQALAYYQKALSLKPDYFAAHNNLGNLYLEQGKDNQALACYQKALSLKPDYASAHNNMGNLYLKQGKLDQAMACYRKALSLKPDDAIVHNNIGNIFREYGRHEAAIDYYQKSLTLNPGYAEAYNNLGTVLQKQGQHDLALGNFQKALSLNPDYAEAHFNLGYAHEYKGQHDRALACYQQALSLNPDYGDARWAITMTRLPAIYAPHDTHSARRTEFTHELDELDSWFTEGRLLHGYRSVGTLQPFFLAYQEENNRDLLSRYGMLCTRLMNEWLEKENFAPPRNITSKAIRLGIVSAHIKNHSVWNALVKGWFQHLSRTHFELYVFHIGSGQDEETVWARSQSTFFAQGGKGLHQWVEIILENQMDILIYPEIGMEPMTAKLASLRLAPVQVAAWGHPETTGFPTMDYYLSAEDFEPHDAQENYTEQLVCLPHLGCCYHRLPVVASESELRNSGIDWETPVFLCPGVPFKYAPQHDRVFTEIARRTGRCRFIFFTYGTGNLSARLQQRLEHAFSKSGLNPADYVTFIPWLNKPSFYGLMKRADVFLDTIGFSGFNTAMQALECSLPVVTREGRFMRGRLASGIFRRMKLQDLVAEDEEAYITMAVRLVQDEQYHRHFQQRIEAARPDLFDDLAPVRALQEFLLAVAKRD